MFGTRQPAFFISLALTASCIFTGGTTWVTPTMIVDGMRSIS
jgi:hypothetical protein